jgi:hypothetical protein
MFLSFGGSQKEIDVTQGPQNDARTAARTTLGQNLETDGRGRSDCQQCTVWPEEAAIHGIVLSKEQPI